MATHRFNGQPSQAADIPTLCQQYLGVEPTFESQYDRLSIRMQDRVQSRIDANNAPDAMVKRYANQMGESHFPAPLLTKDGIPIDGNTRVKARGLRNERFIEAWVVPVQWEGADPITKDKLLLLSQVLNNMNGLPLDESERSKMAETMIRQNKSDEEIVTKVGMPLSKISELRDRHRAAERLTHVGLNVDDLALSATTLRALGKPNAMRLDDDDYRNLTHLAKDAKLKGAQVNSLAVSLNEATSVDSRRERFARERQALEQTILAIQHGQEHPILTGKLRTILIMLLDKPTTAFVENNPENIPEYVELLNKGIDRLQEIIVLQQKQPTTPLGREARVQ